MRYNNHKKYALFIGRWQPFHNGHKYIIDQALTQGKNVCVAIRNTEISDKNPYSAEQRKQMIKRVYGDKLDVIVIPDIESINIGRNVGYGINQVDPPENIGEISGTKVREGACSNIPEEIVAYMGLLNTTLWLTGRPCAGKTTLGKRLKEELDNRGFNVVLLDGDDVRNGLNSNLGFSEDDRKENLRRVGHVSNLFNKNNNLVIATFVSPTNEMRNMIKSLITNFKLVYVNCSLEKCKERDVKGMYRKAIDGEIKEFTGISAPFDEPENPDIVIDTEQNGIEVCVQQLLKELKV